MQISHHKINTKDKITRCRKLTVIDIFPDPVTFVPTFCRR